MISSGFQSEIHTDTIMVQSSHERLANKFFGVMFVEWHNFNIFKIRGIVFFSVNYTVAFIVLQ